MSRRKVYNLEESKQLLEYTSNLAYDGSFKLKDFYNNIIAPVLNRVADVNLVDAYGNTALDYYLRFMDLLPSQYDSYDDNDVQEYECISCVSIYILSLVFCPKIYNDNLEKLIDYKNCLTSVVLSEMGKNDIYQLMNKNSVEKSTIEVFYSRNFKDIVLDKKSDVSKYMKNALLQRNDLKSVINYDYNIVKHDNVCLVSGYIQEIEKQFKGLLINYDVIQEIVKFFVAIPELYDTFKDMKNHEANIACNTIELKKEQEDFIDQFITVGYNNDNSCNVGGYVSNDDDDIDF